MRDSIGARLRRHREDRGVSLAEIAEQTKIKASLLDGLERDDISQWPAGIFRRAYVRAYAGAIGFDADAAVREFLALYPDPIEAAEPAPPPPGGLRALFGSFRRRTLPPIAPAPTLPHAVIATPGTSPAELPAPVLPAPESATAAVPDAAPAVAAREGTNPGLRVRQSRSDSSVTGVKAADLLAAAKVCTELGRVEDVADVLPLLGDAAKILGASGLIVWIWDKTAEELKPALVHGYPSKVRARLHGVGADADNVTAAAYRAGAPLARSGALAIPLLAPSACPGVLAIEVESGREQDAGVRAVATFLAAMLAQLVGAPAAESRGAERPVPRPVVARSN